MSAGTHLPAAALVEKRLPQQQQQKDDCLLPYSLEVSWSHAEVLACARMLSKPADPPGRAEARQGAGDVTSATPAIVEHVDVGWDAPAGGGVALFGFGPACESGAHLAAKCGRTHALERLWQGEPPLAGGGTCYPPLDTRGRGALHAAAAAGATQAVRLLLALDADPTAADLAGESALGLACTSGHRAACELLLAAAPATLQQANNEGSAPLELAAAGGADTCVELLLGLGADADAQSKLGRTALHAAAKAGHLQVCRRLVDHGCSLKLKDRTDRRASEMLPPTAAADGRWLVDLTREAVRQQKAKPATPTANAAAKQLSASPAATSELDRERTALESALGGE